MRNNNQILQFQLTFLLNFIWDFLSLYMNWTWTYLKNERLISVSHCSQYSISSIEVLSIPQFLYLLLYSNQSLIIHTIYAKKSELYLVMVVFQSLFAFLRFLFSFFFFFSWKWTRDYKNSTVFFPQILHNQTLFAE